MCKKRPSLSSLFPFTYLEASIDKIYQPTYLDHAGTFSSLNGSIRNDKNSFAGLIPCVSRVQILYVFFDLKTKVVSCPVWLDWAINWTLGNFLKPLATINMPTFLGKFFNGDIIYHFFSEIFIRQLLKTFCYFLWSHCSYPWIKSKELYNLNLHCYRSQLLAYLG